MYVFAAGAQVLAPYSARRTHDWDKEYVGMEELRRMRLSSGSPLIAAVLEGLIEPSEEWIPEDPGVDQQGFYRLRPPPLDATGGAFCR